MRSMWKAALLVTCAFLLLQGPLVLDARAYLCGLPWQSTLLPPRWQGVHLEDNLMSAAAFFQRFPGGQAAALAGGAPDWNDASGTYTRRAGELMALRSTVEQVNFFSDGVGHNLFHSPAPITQLLCRQGETSFTVLVQGDAQQTARRGCTVEVKAILVGFDRLIPGDVGEPRPVLLFYTDLPLVRTAN